MYRVVQQHKTDSMCFLLVVVFCCFYCYGLVGFLLGFSSCTVHERNMKLGGQEVVIGRIGKEESMGYNYILQNFK